MIEVENDNAIWSKYNDQLKSIAELKLKTLQPTQPQYSLFKKHFATSLNNIGFIYDSQGDINKALEYYSKSLQIQE